MHRDQVDLQQGVIRFSRRKLMNKDCGNSLLRIGQRLSAILAQLPQAGYLFPTFKDEKSNHRSTEFWRRCKTLQIKGRNLHSYRYAWAQRARAAGMPEREAMNHLGHKSRAVHATYAGGAASEWSVASNGNFRTNHGALAGFGFDGKSPPDHFHALPRSQQT